MREYLYSLTSQSRRGLNKLIEDNVYQTEANKERLE